MIHKKILNALPTGLYVLKLIDRETKLFENFFINDANSKIVGIDFQPFVGKTLRESFPESDTHGFPDIYLQCLDTQERVEIGEVQYGDDKVDNQIWYLEVYPIDREHVVLFTENITKLKKIQKELNTQNQFLEHAPDAVLILNDHKRIVLSNQMASTLFQREKEAINQMTVADLLSYNASPNIESARANEEGTIHLPDGTLRNVLCSESHFQIEDEQFTLIFIRDNEERLNFIKKLIEKDKNLEFQNEQLLQFNYITSHDLQEPLKTIEGYTEYLVKNHQEVDADTMLTFLSSIKSAASRMSSMIESLLHHGRIGADFIRKEVDLNESVKFALKNLAGALSETEHELNIQTLHTIQGGEIEMQMYFQNILSNAIKYRSNDRKLVIDVSSEKSGGFVVIKVQDNGLGIAPEHRKKIFNVFQKLQETPENIVGGIGLSTCKKIAQLHHGEIALESELGVGSTFILKIPNNY